MADYDKLDNTMKNLFHVLQEKAIMAKTPTAAITSYKLGWFSSMMVGFLSQQSDETRQAFFDAVDEVIMNHTLHKELKNGVDSESHASVMS